MGKIGKKLSSILSKDKGRSKGLYGLQSVKDITKQEVPVHGDVSGVESVTITDLIPNSLQPRKVFEEEKLRDLSNSIKEKGVIQPIVYRNTANGKEIIAGERRWRAAKLAGLESIPAITKEVTDEEALELAIIENIQRDDLNPIEKALGFKTLIDMYKLTQEQVAGNLGVSRPAVANFMRLLQLPSKIKEYVSRETISMGHARCLLSLANPEQQIGLANKIVKQGLSVRQVEELVYGDKSVKKKKKSEEAKKDPHVIDLEKKLTQLLGTKVKIKNKKYKGNNKGTITIEYYNDNDFKRIAEQIGVDL